MHDFDRIYAEYFSEVYKFALTLCKTPELAEEITQETFFKALKNIDRFNGSCKIGTWLCTIAKNTYYSHAKKQNKQTDFSLLPDLSDESFEERFRSVYKELHADRETGC